MNKQKGRYFSSPKKYERATGEKFTRNCPNAGPYPNVPGMRKLFWGYDRDVVREGKFCYLQPF